MPLFTRSSNLSSTATFFGVPLSTARTLPSTRLVDPSRTRPMMPKYPSGRKHNDIHTATTTTFKTGYVIKEFDISDTESTDSTSTDETREILTNRLLANERFIVDEGSDSDLAPSVSDLNSNTSYSTIVTPRNRNVGSKATLRFSTEGSGPVTCISAARSGQAWVCRGNDRNLLHLYHRNGHKKETRTLKIKIQEVAVRQDKSVFIIPLHSKTVKRVSSTGRATDFYTSADLETSGLCATSRYEILVTTKPVQFSQKKRPRARSKPSVIRLSQTGEIIWDIKTKGADSFVKPDRLAVGKNGDISVIDAEKSREHVVILSPDGELKGKYYGVKDPILSRAFDPRDVCYDANGFIYVADLVNSAVHVLDKQGNFHHFLINHRDGIMYPSALACDTDGFVWVGSSTGVVYVFDVSRDDQTPITSRKPSK